MSCLMKYILVRVNNRVQNRECVSVSRRLAKVLSIFFLAILFVLPLSGGQEFPEAPSSLVTDYTQTLSQAEIQSLEHKLLAFEDTTSTQIAVVIMASTGAYDIADYGVRLAQEWGVGNKKYDNGILLLAALEDRAVTIQTGYGLEGAIPDIIAHRIIQNEITPAFRQQAYYEGIDQATNAIISYSKGEYDEHSSKEGGRKPFPRALLVLVFIAIIAIISRNKGGGGKGGGRIMGGRGSSSVFWWALLNGGRGSNRGGHGGGFGGGSFGGGGGFGGFGGGGFGGGGASGRW